MATRTIFAEDIAEQASAVITMTLQDHQGVTLPLASVVSIRATLYNLADLTTINGVNDVSILNTLIGAYHATSGLLTVTLRPADNVIGAAAPARERHVLLVEWTYDVGGAREGAHEVWFYVRNMAHRP